MGPTTIQDRLRWILEQRRLTAGKLSKAAGLNQTHVATILARKQADVNTKVAYAIAYAAQVSLTWLSTGMGAPDAPDVPKQKPPSKGRPLTLADHPGWTDAAVKAIRRERTLDWAIIGAGEQPLPTPAGELTEWFVLHEAQMFANRTTDQEARIRLDEMARTFVKVHLHQEPLDRPGDRASGAHIIAIRPR